MREQKCIAFILDDLQSKLDALKNHQNETAAELDTLMPSILDRAFRGEL
jgi:type I restriction enzyme, S subunit